MARQLGRVRLRIEQATVFLDLRRAERLEVVARAKVLY